MCCPPAPPAWRCAVTDAMIALLPVPFALALIGAGVWILRAEWAAYVASRAEQPPVEVAYQDEDEDVMPGPMIEGWQ